MPYPRRLSTFNASTKAPCVWLYQIVHHRHCGCRRCVLIHVVAIVINYGAAAAAADVDVLVVV